jgi:hypothetical protein
LQVLPRQIQTISLVLLIAQRKDQIPICGLGLGDDCDRALTKIGIGLRENLLLHQNRMSICVYLSIAQQWLRIQQR